MIELFLVCLAVVGAVAAGYNVMWGVRSFNEPAETARHGEEQDTALTVMLVCGAACVIGALIFL